MTSPLVLGANGLPAQLSDGFITPPGYIDGLQLIWNSASSISVTSGSAYIPSLGFAINASSTLTLSGLSLSASSWYHIFINNNSSTPSINCVTTAPDSPYNGTACAMIGDTSQRYVGSILTDSSGNIVPFEHALNRISYLNGYGSTPYNVLSAGSATASTSISLSSYVPVTATVAQLAYLDNSTSGGTCNIQSSVGSNIVLQVQQISSGGRPALYTQAVFDCPCPSQSIAYFNSASGGSKNIDVIGYVYAR